MWLSYDKADRNIALDKLLFISINNKAQFDLTVDEPGNPQER